MDKHEMSKLAGVKVESRAPRTERFVAEARIGMGMPMHGRGSLHGRVRVGAAAMGEVVCALGDCYRWLERVGYSDSLGAEKAKAVMAGSFSALETNVKALAYSVCEMPGEYARKDEDYYWTYNADSSLLTLRGEIAEAMAVMDIVAKDLLKVSGASREDYYGVDFEGLAKAWPSFSEGVVKKFDSFASDVRKVMELEAKASGEVSLSEV